MLVEAGGAEPVLSDLPLLYSALQMTPIDWQYKSEPCLNSNLGMKERRSNWPRGKVMGGSSVLNAMLYIRGNRNDYDNWAQQGNPGVINIITLQLRLTIMYMRRERFF